MRPTPRRPPCVGAGPQSGAGAGASSSSELSQPAVDPAAGCLDACPRSPADRADGRGLRLRPPPSSRLSNPRARHSRRAGHRRRSTVRGIGNARTRARTHRPRGEPVPDDSELSRLNAAAGREVAVSPDLFEAIEVALGMAEATDGLVDPTVGVAMNRLGYDRDFADVLHGVDGELPAERPVPGWRSVALDADRRAVGLPRRTPRSTSARPPRRWQRTGRRRPSTARSDVASWSHSAAMRRRPGRHPLAGSPSASRTPCTSPEPAEAIAISSGGLASSGIGVRQWRLGPHRVHHIVDPATGLSAAPCWRTVSVAAATCVQANAASTAAIVLGEPAVKWLEARRLPARLVRLDGTVVRTAAWPIHRGLLWSRRSRRAQ